MHRIKGRMKGRRKMFVLIMGVGISLLPVAGAKNIYVSPSGDEGNAGTFESPKKSLQAAVEVLGAGDTLYLLEGIYRQVVKKNVLRGVEGKPVVICANPGHQVTLDGTVDITSTWTKHEGNIWKTTLDTSIWQLFMDGKMMTSARWPNAEAWTSAMWDKNGRWGHQASGSTYGHFIDNGSRNLAGTGIDFTGAIAILNVGSWLSFAEKVDSHGAGSNDFTYTPHFTEAQYHHNITNGSYFFEAAMVCLDAPNEWWFNPFTYELFLIPEDGLDPSGRQIQGKTLTYALEIYNADYLEIRDIDFFGCTVKLDDTKRSVLENCNFLYPSYSKRMLGSIQFAEPTYVSGGSQDVTSQNKVINCSFEKTDGSGLKIVGRYDLVENCYFHNIDYSCVGGLNDITVASVSTRNFTFRYNTIDMAGNSLGVKTGNSCLVEYNRVSNIGFLQHDGSAIQCSEIQLSEVLFRRNWIHDCIKAALRFDSPWVNPDIYGKYGTMRYNVAWRSTPMVPKGDYHKISHNTAFDCREFDISIFSDVSHGGVNTHTVTRNNAVNAFSGANVSGIVPIPGIVDHNWEGISFNPDQDLKHLLYDPANLDFRPRPGSELVDAGEFYSGQTEGFIGARPDIGAYEFGDSIYWMGGRRHPYASSPIPADNGRSHYEFVDLIWLKAYRSVGSDVYFGSSEIAVENAGTGSGEYKGRINNNIFCPGALVKDQTYYWRIDAVMDNKIVKGEVWSFTAGTDANPLVHQATFNIYGRKGIEVYYLDSTRVRMDEKQAVTASDGQAAIPMVKPGGYDYTLSRKGYSSGSGSIQLVSDTLVTDTLDFETYRVKLLVEDEKTREAIEGAAVDFSGQQFVSDSSGYVTIEGVEYRQYLIGASAADYLPVQGTEVLVYSDTLIRIQLKKNYLHATMTISDRVSGAPVYRAFVSSGDETNLTNSSGVVTMDELLVGSWIYAIEHDSYFTLTDSMNIHRDTSIQISLTPKLASIRFEISASGVPAAYAKLVVGTWSALSDNKGMVLMYRRPARMEYHYSIEKEGYQTLYDSIWLDIDTTLKISLGWPSGIVDPSDAMIKICPNPAVDILNLEVLSTGGSSYTVMIFNITGQTVFNAEFTQPRKQIDVSQFRGGLYFVAVKAGNHLLSLRIQVIK